MSLGHLAGLTRWELEKLLRRRTSWLALVVAALAGAAGVGLLMLYVLASADTAIAAAKYPGVRGPPPLDASYVVFWCLELRAIIVYPLLLMVLCAISTAGDLDRRTFREIAVRAVPRWGAGAARYLALLAWIVLAALVTVGLGLGLWVVVVLLVTLTGTEYFGPDRFALLGDATLLDITLPFFVTVMAEAMFAAMAAMFGVLTRSVPATLGLSVLVALVQLGAAIVGLTVMLNLEPRNIAGIAQLTGLPEGLLDTVRDVTTTLWTWQPPFLFLPGGVSWQSLLTMTVLVAAFLGLATWRLQRMELP